MKQTALIIAVLALAGVVILGGPAWAGTVQTSVSTEGSTQFGFQPTTANLGTFTMMGTTAASPGAIPLAGCGAGPSFTCSSTSYVPIAGTMSGAYTSHPDRTVSTLPDWGCGANVSAGGGGCVEAATNYMDRVLGNNVPADGANTAPGVGTSDVATACGITGGCATDGVLTGNLHSVIALANTGDPDDGDMPFGTITFDRTSALSVSLDQNINQNVAGLYSFQNHDFTNANWTAVTTRSFGNAPNFPHMIDSNIQTDLSFTQAAMGGDAGSPVAAGENTSYSTIWTNGGAHPGGNYFSPGLNNRDWAGNGAQAPAPGDFNGFRP